MVIRRIRHLTQAAARLPEVRNMATASGSSALMKPLAFRNHPEIKIPRLVYGTAWKKDQTATLVYQALKAGFRAIDTAAQPRHYNEAQVGEGIRRAINEGIVKREDIYIQTKFTPPSGQDPNNMPYTLSMLLEGRIHSSIIDSSLKNFTFPGSGEPYIDCLVLHSPLPTVPETLAAWKAFAFYVPRHIKSLGISNTSLQVLQYLYADAAIKPSVVQNRFYPETRWEGELREWCREKGIVFQSFWTLTGNPGIMRSEVVKEVSEALKGKGIEDEKAVAVYALVLGLKGTSVLNGTTNEWRMRNDLEGLEIVGNLIEGEWEEKWDGWLAAFKQLIDEPEI